MGKDEDNNKIVFIQVGEEQKVLYAGRVVADIDPNVSESEANLVISQDEIDRLYQEYENARKTKMVIIKNHYYLVL